MSAAVREAPGWAASAPHNWGRDWLKWNVRFVTERPSDEDQDRLPYISNEDIASWTGRIVRDELQPSEADGRGFQPGDVLLNKLRPYLAKVYHAEFQGIGSGELLCLRSSSGVLPRFLFYVVSSQGFIETISAEAFGAKMPRADWDIVGHQPLPLPSIETQRRIARFLDERTARIDALIEKKRALLQRLGEKRQALITHAVTKGLNPSARLRPSGVDWLGDIPSHWEVKLLRHLRRYLTSGSRDWAAYYADAGDAFLRMTNITRDGIELDLSDLRYVNLEREIEGTRTATREGDILITITAELGVVAIVREGMEGAYINQHVALFRATDCSPEFLVNVLSTDMARAQLTVSGQGGTKQGLGFDQIKAVVVAVPPPQEQTEISVACAEVRRETAALEGPLRDSIDRLWEYRSALIGAAVTGQVEPRDL